MVARHSSETRGRGLDWLSDRSKRLITSAVAVTALTACGPADAEPKDNSVRTEAAAEPTEAEPVGEVIEEEEPYTWVGSWDGGDFRNFSEIKGPMALTAEQAEAWESGDIQERGRVASEVAAPQLAVLLEEGVKAHLAGEDYDSTWFDEGDEVVAHEANRLIKEITSRLQRYNGPQKVQADVDVCRYGEGWQYETGDLCQPDRIVIGGVAGEPNLAEGTFAATARTWVYETDGSELVLDNMSFGMRLHGVDLERTLDLHWVAPGQ